MALVNLIIEFFNQATVFFVENLIPALILIAIGWVIGNIVGRITSEILERLKIDKYITKGRFFFRISNIFSIIFRWAVYLVFIQAAVGLLGIPALENVVATILSFIPGLAGAIIVLVVGYVIAEYVKTNTEKSNLPYSEIMSKILFWLIIYISIGMALPLVKIDPTLINNILLIIIGSFGLGLAIAIGLGLKDVIAAYSKRYLKRSFRK